MYTLTILGRLSTFPLSVCNSNIISESGLTSIEGITNLFSKNSSLFSVHAKFAVKYSGGRVVSFEEKRIHKTKTKKPIAINAITPNLLVQNAASVNVMV